TLGKLGTAGAVRRRGLAELVIDVGRAVDAVAGEVDVGELLAVEHPEADLATQDVVLLRRAGGSAGPAARLLLLRAVREPVVALLGARVGERRHRDRRDAGRGV